MGKEKTARDIISAAKNVSRQEGVELNTAIEAFKVAELSQHNQFLEQILQYMKKK